MNTDFNKIILTNIDLCKSSMKTKSDKITKKYKLEETNGGITKNIYDVEYSKCLEIYYLDCLKKSNELKLNMTYCDVVLDEYRLTKTD